MSINNQTPQQTNIYSGSIQGLVQISEVHFNVAQEVIVTTEDKIKLCLSEHIKTLEKKKSWIAPLGILITIIVTLTTTIFKTMWLEAATWKAIFIIGAVISGIWLIIAVVQAWNSISINDIVHQLKTDSKRTQNSETKG